MNCIHGQKRILVLLLAFSTLLVCILQHCWLRDWCGNKRNDISHVVWRLDESASFRFFDSSFYFPHSAIPHFTQYQIYIISWAVTFCLAARLKHAGHGQRYAWKPQTTAEYHRPPQDCQENRSPLQITGVYIVCDTVSLADTK